MITIYGDIEVRILDMCIDNNGVSVHIKATDYRNKYTGELWESLGYPLNKLLLSNNPKLIIDTLVNLDPLFSQYIIPIGA